MVRVVNENGFVLTEQPTRGLANQWLLDNYPNYTEKESNINGGRNNIKNKQVLPFPVYFENVG